LNLKTKKTSGLNRTLNLKAKLINIKKQEEDCEKLHSNPDFHFFMPNVILNAKSQFALNFLTKNCLVVLVTLILTKKVLQDWC
jgi:hypothetical protein